MEAKGKQGISLIVLVITIIVMIILAVAIILSLSSSNIIENANTAVKNVNKANVQQIVTLARAEYNLLSDEEKEGKTFKKHAEDKLKEVGIKEGKYEITETGKVYTIPVIPKGFYHVGGTVDEGFIISDKVVDEGKGT